VNISIHGIDEAKVEGAPTLPGIADRMYGFLDGQVVVSHTHFDRVAIHQVCSKYNLRLPSCTWLDSARVARRAWEQFASGGYGLHNVCSILGYQFAHHDALEDAKAAAHIIVAAIQRTGIDVQGWLRRVEQPIHGSNGCNGLVRPGNPEGPCYGEVLVFTGALTIPRGKAAGMAAKIGCTVATGVTKETTLLVIGDQDIRKLAGQEKSSKHRKAEKLMQRGQAIMHGVKAFPAQDHRCMRS